MSFFIRNNKGNNRIKRKKDFGKDASKGHSKFKKRKEEPDPYMNEEISSDSDLSPAESDNDVEDEVETAQEKKLKLAKKYLEEIEREEKERLESNAVVNGELLANRLKEDALSQAGKLRRKVAEKLRQVSENEIHVLRNKSHNLSVTCVVVSGDGKFIYSASKDANIVKWSIAEKKKVNCIPNNIKSKGGDKKGHSCVISALAVSHAGKYLVSGDVKGVINVWNADTLEYIESFSGHKGPLTGLAICKETNHLYSCSGDHSVKLWNLEEMMYVETLFGHQSAVTSIAVLSKDRALSSGGTDNSIRVWKITEESQLIFNGSGRTVDDVTRLDDTHFASCGEDGLVSVWGIFKKKPFYTLKDAHGLDPLTNQPNWIVSVAALPSSDLLASGSCDGLVRLWKISDNYKNVEPLFQVKINGFVNSMAFTPDERFLVLGVGQEHKLGRWSRIKEAKNSIVLIELTKKL